MNFKVMPQNRHKTGFRGPSPDVGKTTQFKRENRANPGGRPKSAPLSQACRELLAAPVPDDPEGRTYAQVIAETLAQKALPGDIRAAQEIADRAEGKARQSFEIENAALRDAFERMSGEELLAYATTGKVPDWFPRSDQSENIQ